MQKLTLPLLVLSTLLGCKAWQRAVTSEPLTDETKAAITGRCDQGLEPDGNRGDRLKLACECLSAKGGDIARLASPYCRGGADIYFERVVAVGKAEGKLVLTDTAGNSPDVEAATCADQLVAMRIESHLDRVLSACKQNNVQTMRSFLTLPRPEPAGSCWRLVHMTADGCVEAAPCSDQGSASIAALPISDATRASWRGADPVPEGATVRLCNATIQAMQHLKDPTAAMERYNYPFANFLSLGSSNIKITYGAANCHGTAQALAGGFLDQVAVMKLDYHSDSVRAACSPLAESAWQDARQTTSGHPTGASLPIGKGGHVVNMIHDDSCSADDCGEASFNTYACSGDQLESHIFHNDMCVNCWGKHLEKAGYKPLPTTATWTDLTPGCVLTQNDHSVTTVFQNDGFCYFYESLSPYAAPQLNVSECQTLFAAFERRWCPARSLAFELQR